MLKCDLRSIRIVGQGQNSVVLLKQSHDLSLPNRERERETTLESRNGQTIKSKNRFKKRRNNKKIHSQKRVD